MPLSKNAQALPHIANVLGTSVKLHQKFYLQRKTIAYLQEFIYHKVREQWKNSSHCRLPTVCTSCTVYIFLGHCLVDALKFLFHDWLQSFGRWQSIVMRQLTIENQFQYGNGAEVPLLNLLFLIVFPAPFLIVWPISI